jgi:hypothetical protein
MTDNAPSVIDVRDDGLVGTFKVSGSVGVTPNRPVCVTGNLQVQQICVIADRYLGVVSASGSDGDNVSVRRRGSYKAYVTGIVTCGDTLVATGTAAAACFKTAAAVNYVSGSAYVTQTNGAFKNAATALQNGADGDLILIDLGA